MNFIIEPECFYSLGDRLQIMVEYKSEYGLNSKICSKWIRLNGVIVFNEFYDDNLLLPNIHNIISIQIQLKFNNEYYIYIYEDNLNKFLQNINKENKIKIKIKSNDFYPQIIINNIISPVDTKISTESNNINDDCIIL